MWQERMEAGGSRSAELGGYEQWLQSYRIMQKWESPRPVLR
jgi:hypothetical protein